MRLLALTLAAALAPAAHAGEIDHGTITVGRGVRGAKLDMTRTQVVDKLGRPIAANGPGVMSYLRPSNGIFDVYRYRDTKRVRMFIVSARGRGFKLRDGNHVFVRGAIDRLYDHYGSRVRPFRDPVNGDSFYVIDSRYHGRPVETRFEVNRLSRKRALVRNLIILFTDRPGF